MNSKLNKTLIAYIYLYLYKKKFVMQQQYEDAIKFRESERRVQKEFDIEFKRIYGQKGSIDFYWVEILKMNKMIKEIPIDNIDLIITKMKRTLKIKDVLKNG